MGHYGLMIEGVKLNLLGNFLGVENNLRVVGEKLKHFLLAFEILLHGVAHAFGVVKVFSGIQAY